MAEERGGRVAAEEVMIRADRGVEGETRGSHFRDRETS